MKYAIFSFALLFLYSSAQAESKYEKLIIGTWDSKNSNSKRTFNFNKDGSYHIVKPCKKGQYEEKGKWRIEGSRLLVSKEQEKVCYDGYNIGKKVGAWSDAIKPPNTSYFYLIQNIDENTIKAKAAMERHGKTLMGVDAHFTRIK